jgi:hypothetical protein
VTERFAKILLPVDFSKAGAGTDLTVRYLNPVFVSRLLPREFSGPIDTG